MADEGLTYNAGNISQLADDIKGQLDAFNFKVSELFNFIDRLKNEGYWTGSVYDSFKANIEKYKKDEIDPMVASIETWISTLRDCAVDAASNTQKGINLVA